MNLLITGAWRNAKEYIKKLENKGYCIQYMQQETDSLPCDYPWVEGIICNGIFLTHSIELFVNLKYIQLTSAGFDRVPIDYVNDRGIKIYNAHGVYSIPMAEFAVSAVLQFYKQSNFFYKNQSQHRWEKNRNLLELYGQTVCVIGCGNVGNECAKRFQAFGCKVIGVDSQKCQDTFYDAIYPIDNINDALAQSDIIILAVPLNEDTYHFMDKSRFDCMKQSAVLINIARGAVIDTNDLIKKAPELGCVVLDVFEEEPLPSSSPLWEMENVIITPHNSFVSNNNDIRLSKVIFNHLFDESAGNN